MAPPLPSCTIGRTGVSVSVLGLGTSMIGNLYRPLSDGEARETLDTALAIGMTYVDTAPHYGRGLSERRVGDAVRGRDSVILSTKVGRLMLPDASVRDDRERDGFCSPMPFRPVYDYSRDGILRSWEASLHRLGLAKVDLLFVHDIGRLSHGEDHDRTWRELTSGGGLRALEELRESGEIAGFGIGVNEVPICLDVMSETRLDAILLAGRYTLLEQAPLDDLLPICTKADTSVIVGGPYNSGILATGVKQSTLTHYNYARAPQDIIDRVGEIEDIAAQYNVPIAALALQFPLAHPQVASVIPGIGNAKQVHDTMALLTIEIPSLLWSELKNAGLVRVDAPVPQLYANNVGGASTAQHWRK
ncbi:MAG: aldo/keto reductase [Sphingobium sp.]